MKNILMISMVVMCFMTCCLLLAEPSNSKFEIMAFSGSELSWLAVNPTAPETMYVSNTDSSSGIAGLYRSLDGGATWEGAPDPIGEKDIACIAVSKTNPELVWAGGAASEKSKYVYRSTDYGATWTEKKLPLVFVGGINSITIDPVNPKVAYFAAMDGLYKTTNGGEKITQLSYPIGPLTTLGVAIDPTNTDVIYAGTAMDTLYKSTDGGASFVGKYVGMTNKIGNIANILIDPDNTANLYVHQYWGTPPGYLAANYKSTDSGETWEPFGVAAASNDFIIDYADPNTLIWGTIFKGMLYSTTKGEGVATFTKGYLPTTVINKMVLDTKDHLHCICATSTGLYEISLNVPPEMADDLGGLWHNRTSEPPYTAELTWSPVAKNEDGGVLDDLDGYVIYRVLGDPKLMKWEEPFDTLKYTGEEPKYLDSTVKFNSPYWYRVAAMDTKGAIGTWSNMAMVVTGVGDGNVPPVFSKTELLGNNPNPFNPVTVISFVISDEYKDGVVTTIEIYDISGSKIATLINGEKKLPGKYSVQWNGKNTGGNTVSSGIYFCRMSAGNTVETQKMLMVK